MEKQKTISDIQTVLSNIKYKDWQFMVHEGMGGFLIYPQPPIGYLEDKFGVNREKEYLEHIKRLMDAMCQKWYLSSWSTDTEVVRTVYKMIMYWEMINVEARTHDSLQSMRDPYFSILYLENKTDKDLLEAMTKHFKYKDWTLKFEARTGGFLIQIVFEANDNSNPDVIEMQHCRKWYVEQSSNFTSRNWLIYFERLVGTAIKTAEEHEISEMFLYLGQPIYNPHINMNEMASFLSEHQYDVRL